MAEKQETTYWDCKDRYQNDPAFKQLVDLLMHHAMTHKYTPGELRDAAFMAALNYEALHVREVMVNRHEFEGLPNREPNSA